MLRKCLLNSLNGEPSWKSCHLPIPSFLGPWYSSPVLGSDVGHDVLIEELQDQRDAVGKDQVLGHVFKLKPREDK